MAQSNNWISSVEGLLTNTEKLVINPDYSILFRGQDTDDSLLPKIARKDPKINTKDLEKIILSEYRRRMAYIDRVASMDDWDLIVYAQHYGLATRLLDWTSNPLLALWFACKDNDKSKNGYVYLLLVDPENLVDRSRDKSPFSITGTRILKPNLNNERVIAQQGWFTVHRYSQQVKEFVDLHRNTSLKSKVLMKGVRGEYKEGILCALDKLGINHESVYLGPEGTSKYINWVYRNEI